MKEKNGETKNKKQKTNGKQLKWKWESFRNEASIEKGERMIQPKNNGIQFETSDGRPLLIHGKKRKGYDGTNKKWHWLRMEEFKE